MNKREESKQKSVKSSDYASNSASDCGKSSSKKTKACSNGRKCK